MYREIFLTEEEVVFSPLMHQILVILQCQDGKKPTSPVLWSQLHELCWHTSMCTGVPLLRLWVGL